MEKDYLNKVFLSGLLPTSSEALATLQEVIANYQHIFNGKRPVPLDQLLEQAVAPQKVYRGLPRLYHRNNPVHSYIKKRFAHLPSLQKVASVNGASSIKESVELKNKVLSLMCWCIPERPEDAETVSFAYSLLQEKFPDLAVQLVSPLEIQALKKSDLILQMPTFYPETRSLLQHVPKVRMEYLGGLGLMESSWFHPKSGGYSLGLHCLEKGILFPRQKEFTWEDVENSEIRRFRNPLHSFHLALVSSREGAESFLKALLSMHKKDPRRIDIVTNQGDFFKASPDKVRVLSVENLSIQDQCALMYLSDDFVCVRGDGSFAEAIFYEKPFFFDGTSDMRYLFKDLLAIAENRLVKYPFAQKALRANYEHYALHLPEQRGEWVDETFFIEDRSESDVRQEISSYFSETDAIEGFKQLCRVIKEEHNAEAFLTSLVKRGLMLSDEIASKTFVKNH